MNVIVQVKVKPLIRTVDGNALVIPNNLNQGHLY